MAISAPGEVDQYTFSLASESQLYLDSLTSNSNVNWTLVGPGGTVVAARDFDNSDGATLGLNPILDLIPGDYELAVQASGDTTGDYAFRVLDVVSATAITPGTEVDGELNPANETNLYGFTAKAGDQYYFDSQGVDGLSAAAIWRLVDPDRNIIFSKSLSYDVDTLTLPLTGHYTLMVEGYIGDPGSGTYSFTVQPVVKAIPQSLSLNSTVHGDIGRPGKWTSTRSAWPANHNSISIR